MVITSNQPYSQLISTKQHNPQTPVGYPHPSLGPSPVPSAYPEGREAQQGTQPRRSTSASFRRMSQNSHRSSKATAETVYKQQQMFENMYVCLFACLPYS